MMGVGLLNDLEARFPQFKALCFVRLHELLALLFVAAHGSKLSSAIPLYFFGPVNGQGCQVGGGP